MNCSSVPSPSLSFVCVFVTVFTHVTRITHVTDVTDVTGITCSTNGDVR